VADVSKEVEWFCLGIEFLGRCSYRPSQPYAVYFSLGEIVGALAFTLALQQLLKPIYIFRLNARRTPISLLYLLVLAGTTSVIFAALVPNFPALHSDIWGYAIVWELIGALLFALAYGAVILAATRPVTAKPARIIAFCRSSVQTLSFATEADCVDYARDLERSLPAIIKAAKIVDRRHEQPTAFYTFIHRHQIERGAYAANLLAVLADPMICKSLVSRSPWLAASMIKKIDDESLFSDHATHFVRELAHQAVTGESSMMAREIRYRGFGSAPALSERLFSSAFIVDRYNPFDWLFSDRADPSLEVLKRYNSAARRAIKALIAQRKIQHVYAMYQIANFYEWLFMSAYKIQDSQAPNNSFISEMTRAVELAIEMANHLLANVDAPTYESLFVDQLNDRPSDMLDALVEITMEAWLGIANRFKGFDDHFWLLAIQSFDKAFPMHRDQPDGVTPFQQRLMIRVLDKLRDNIKGFYPSISRVLLACVGDLP
jgi:hypothetical protein